MKKDVISHKSLVVEPWPEDAFLFQPFETEQILLAENASCLAVKAYLKMCDLPFTTQTCENAEFISPGGRMTKLPVLKVGAFVIAEFEPIVNFVESRGISLTGGFDPDAQSDLRAYLSLVENVFTNAELYISWMDEDVLTQITLPRYRWAFPYPLDLLQSWYKKRQVLKHLKVFSWKQMTMDEVAEKVGMCCETLSRKLKDQKYFYGNTPTELDAVVFGHLFNILTTKLPNKTLSDIVGRYKNLNDFCKIVETEYFKDHK